MEEFAEDVLLRSLDKGRDGVFLDEESSIEEGGVGVLGEVATDSGEGKRGLGE